MSKQRRSFRSELQRRAGDTALAPEEYDYHLPVMLRECCDFLVTQPDGVYIDGTLGGGGHTAEILRRLGENGKLYSFDADTTAIDHCKEKFAEELAKGADSRLVLRNENFYRACSIKEEGESPSPNGILLDLGVSSRQLDSASIGLSYRVNSRLDMRFGSHGQTAENILATYEEDAIVHVLRLYGEEPQASKIARRIVQRRRAVPLRTTADLRELVEECVPPPLHAKTLSRVFQALRIAVNDELTILEQTLRGIIPVLAQSGRIVVLSYHSLEDRIVKVIFKEFSQTRIPDSQNLKSATREIEPILHVLTKKPLEPSPEEIARNPRSRSAKLRVAEKA